MKNNLSKNKNIEEEIVNFLEKYIAIPLLFFMFFMVLAQIFSRSVIGKSLRWTEEFSNTFFIWLIFISAAISFSRNEMVKLDFFLNIMPNKIKKIVLFLHNALFIMISLILIPYSFRAISLGSGRGLYTLPITWSYLYVPVMLFFIIILVLGICKIDLISLFRKKSKVVEKK